MLTEATDEIYQKNESAPISSGSCTPRPSTVQPLIESVTYRLDSPSSVSSLHTKRHRFLSERRNNRRVFFFVLKSPRGSRGALLHLIPSDTEPQEQKKCGRVAEEDCGAVLHKEQLTPKRCYCNFQDYL